MVFFTAQTPSPIVITTQATVSPQTGYPSIKDKGYVSTPPPIQVSSQAGIIVSVPESGSTTPYPTIINQSHGSTGFQVSKLPKINYIQ